MAETTVLRKVRYKQTHKDIQILLVDDADFESKLSNEMAPERSVAANAVLTYAKSMFGEVPKEEIANMPVYETFRVYTRRCPTMVLALLLDDIEN